MTPLNIINQNDGIPLRSPFCSPFNPDSLGLPLSDIAGKPLGWSPPPSVISRGVEEAKGWLSRNFSSLVDQARNLLLPGGLSFSGLLAADAAALPAGTVALYGGGAFLVGFGAGALIGYGIDNIPRGLHRVLETAHSKGYLKEIEIKDETIADRIFDYNLKKFGTPAEAWENIVRYYGIRDSLQKLGDQALDLVGLSHKPVRLLPREKREAPGVSKNPAHLPSHEKNPTSVKVDDPAVNKEKIGDNEVNPPPVQEPMSSDLSPLELTTGSREPFYFVTSLGVVDFSEVASWYLATHLEILRPASPQKVVLRRRPQLPQGAKAYLIPSQLRSFSQSGLSHWHGWKVAAKEQNVVGLMSPDGQWILNLKGEIPLPFGEGDEVDILPCIFGGCGEMDLPHSLKDYSQSPIIPLNGTAYRLRWEPIDYSRSQVLKEDWINFKSVHTEGGRVMLTGTLSEVSRFLIDGKQPRSLSRLISENAKDFNLELSLEDARRFKILNARNEFLGTHEFYVEQIGNEEKGR